MYVPSKFKINDPELVRAFIRQHPFGLLLSTEGGQIHDTHTPFLIDADERLMGHIAKANGQWKGWPTSDRVKVIFSGPHAYISPNYYVSEFAVPTWNYAAVSVTGRISIIEDESEILEFLKLLVTENEPADEPWSFDPADKRYLSLLKGIVVFSVSMDAVEASFKMNQNKSEQDQLKVIDSLSATGCPHDRQVANMMGQMMPNPNHERMPQDAFSPDCVFCRIANGEVDRELTVFENKHVFIQMSLHQKAANRGHVLVIPKQHVADVFEVDHQLDAPLLAAVRAASRAVKKAFSADGIQVRQNNGAAAGQDVHHLHFHVIPRYHGDAFETMEYQVVPLEERAMQAEKLKSTFGP